MGGKRIGSELYPSNSSHQRHHRSHSPSLSVSEDCPLERQREQRRCKKLHLCGNTDCYAESSGEEVTNSEETPASGIGSPICASGGEWLVRQFDPVRVLLIALVLFR